MEGTDLTFSSHRLHSNSFLFSPLNNLKSDVWFAIIAMMALLRTCCQTRLASKTMVLLSEQLKALPWQNHKIEVSY